MAPKACSAFLFVANLGVAAAAPTSAPTSAPGTAGKKALVIIDVQDCFLENGTLPVVASQIIPKLNEIRNEKDCLFDVVVKSQDFHPSGHISFGTTHGMPQDTANAEMSNSWRGAMSMKCIKDEGNAACCPAVYVDRPSITCSAADAVQLEYCPTSEDYYADATNPTMAANPACTTCKTNPDDCFDQTMDMWLDHCLQDGDSTLSASLVSKDTDKVVQKGQQSYVEMFSAFFDNTRQYSSDLHSTLQEHGVTEVFVAGIATTHCVRWTVQDAVFLGYKTNIVMDASAGIWGTPSSYADEAEGIADLEGQGITVLNTADILSMACPVVPDTAVSATVAPFSVLAWKAVVVLLACACMVGPPGDVSRQAS